MADTRSAQAPREQGRRGKSPRALHTHTRRRPRDRKKEASAAPAGADLHREPTSVSSASVSPEAASSRRRSRPPQGLRRTASSATVPQCPESGRRQGDRPRPLVVAFRAQVRERPLGPSGEARAHCSLTPRPRPLRNSASAVPAVASVLSLNKPEGSTAQALFHPEPRFL